MVDESFALICHSFMMLCLAKSQSYEGANSIDSEFEARKSLLAIANGCICPSHMLTLECTIASAVQWGITVWEGTSFDCPNSDNAINLLHARYLATGGVSGACNNGSIVAQILRVDHANTTYKSQLNVTINSDVIGQKVTCFYDDGYSIIIGSLMLNQKAQFIPSNINYSVSRSGSRTTISFVWRSFNISTCQAIPYIVVSNCGSCPTTTNQTTVTCTDVPTNATNCYFALMPTICGSLRVSPYLSVYLNVELIMKDSISQIAVTVAISVVVTLVVSIVCTSLVCELRNYIRNRKVPCANPPSSPLHEGRLDPEMCATIQNIKSDMSLNTVPVNDIPKEQSSGVGEERTEEGSTRVSKVEVGTTCNFGVQMVKNVSYQPSTNLILTTNPAYGTSRAFASI